MDRVLSSRDRRAATALAIGLLTLIALVLRRSLAIDGVLDTDVVNFGLAAVRFDLLQHQPHPPGYPGYVLLLKALHGLLGLQPLAVAQWAIVLCGAATVPATYWAARMLAPDQPAAPAAVAAALCAVNPLLWYYGGDGQSHAAEALVAVVLVGGAAAVRQRPSRLALALVFFGFGLAGAIRPTIYLVCLPLALWLLWGRPLGDWLLAALVAAVAVALWVLPLIHLTGGWQLYQRSSDALYALLYDRYSVFGALSTGATVLTNLSKALWSAAFGLIPLIALDRPRGPAWRWVLPAGIGVSVLFFALTFIAEPGYLSGAAALACLAPVSWPSRTPRALKLRAAVALLLGPVVFLFAPAEVPLGGSRATMLAPSLAHVAQVEALQTRYGQLLWAATGGEPSLVLTDNLDTTYNRPLPLTCPHAMVALTLIDHPHPLRPNGDCGVVMSEAGMRPFPTPVPLEPGPPATVTLPRSVRRVIVAPDASERLVRAVRAAARCAPAALPPALSRASGGAALLLYPARCLPRLPVGPHVLEIAAR